MSLLLIAKSSSSLVAITNTFNERTIIIVQIRQALQQPHRHVEQGKSGVYLQQITF